VNGFGGFLAGAIVGKMILDRTQWAQSVSKVKQDEKSLAGTASRLSQKFAGVGKALTLAGGAIVGTLGMMVKSYIKAGDEVHKMALRTGFATETLSELRYAAQISGTNLDSLERAVKRMQKTIVDASEGMTTYQRAFERIGVNYEELLKLHPEQQFEVLAKAIAAVEDPTIRAATAQDIFGRAGTQLLPLFAQGVEGMEALRQKAHELGMVFDQEAADKAARLADAQATLKGAIQGLTIAIAENIVPVLSRFVEGLSGVISKISGWMKANPVLASTITKVASVLGGLMAVFGPMLLLLPKLAAGFTLMKTAMLAATGPVGIAVAAITGLITVGTLVYKNWDKISKFLVNIWHGIGDKAVEIFGKIKEFIINSLYWLVEKISKVPLAGKFVKPWKEALAEARREMASTETVVSEKSLEMARAFIDSVKRTDAYRKASDFLGKKLKWLASSISKVTEEENKLGKAVKVTTKEIKTQIEAASGVVVKIGWWGAELIDIGKIVENVQDKFERWSNAVVPAARDMSEVLDDVADSFETVRFEGEKTETVSEDLAKAFSNLGSVLQVLADEIGGNLGNLISSIGLAFGQLKESAEKSAKGILEAIGPGLMGKIGGSIGQMVSGAKKSFASLGSAIGSAVAMIPGIGTAAGAVITAIGGFIGGLFKKAKTEAERLAEEMEMMEEDITKAMSKFGEISESTAKKIAEADREMSGFAAVSKYFGDVIRDVGVTQENVNDLWKRASQIVGHWKKGYLSASDATKALNDSFRELLRGTQELGEEGSAAMVNFILKVRKSGLEVKAVSDYVVEQLDRIPSALSTLIDSYDKVDMSVQEMGDIAVQTFGAMLASGVSWTDAVSKMSEPLAALRDKYQELGMSSDGALKKLFNIVGVTEKNKELFKSIEANKEILEALGNSGWLTADAMKSLTKNATSYYEQLKAAGLSSNDALRAMGPTLQKIQDYADAYGLQIDDNTQKLIDQAKEIGVVKETQKSAIEEQKTMFKELGDRIEKIMDDLGERIEKTFRTAFGDAFKDAKSKAEDTASAIDKEFRNIRPTVRLNFDYEAPSFGSGIRGGRTERVGHFQQEGIAWRPQLAWVGERRPEAIVDIAKFNAGVSRLQNILVPRKPSMVINSVVNIYPQRLDDRTIDEAAQKIFAAVDRQVRRRGYGL